MMRKVFIMLLMPLALSMGCSKNNDDSQKNCNVEKITRGNTEFTFEYDEQGRVSVCHSKEKSGDEVYLNSERFSYFSDRIEVKKYDEEYGQVTNTIVFKLDVSGNIISETNTYNLVSTFTYDANGYLIKQENPDDSTADYLELKYENDNLVWRLYRLGMGDRGDLIDEESFKYNAILANVPYSAYFSDLLSLSFLDAYKHVLYEQGYFGKKSKNQLVEVVGERKFNYGKNSHNKVNQVTIQYINDKGWSDSISKIEYTCDSK